MTLRSFSLHWNNDTDYSLNWPIYYKLNGILNTQHSCDLFLFRVFENALCLLFLAVKYCCFNFRNSDTPKKCKAISEQDYGDHVEYVGEDQRKPELMCLLKIFGGHMYFLWGHWYPYFELLMTSALGFKARVDSFACVLCHLHSPLVQHLLTS